MKKLTLCIISTLVSVSLQATELPLLKQDEKIEIIGTGFVELDGIDYEKVIDTRTLQSTTGGERFNTRNAVKPTLYRGDMLKRGKLFAIERVSGSIYISSSDARVFNELAKTHHLNISYSNNNRAILQAPKGKELLSLLKTLKADKRVKKVSLERITNRLKPQ